MYPCIEINLEHTRIQINKVDHPVVDPIIQIFLLERTVSKKM